MLIALLLVTFTLGVLGFMFYDAPTVDPDHPWAGRSALDEMDRRGNVDITSVRDALDGGGRR